MKKLPLFPTLLVMFFVILMTSMGFWQIRRAAEKENLLELLADKNTTKISQVQQIKDLPKYANIKLSGHYLNTPQLLLDNQINDGQQGYHVFTPFKLDSLKLYLMINRGWVAKKGFDKKQLTASSKTQTLLGKLNTPPQVGIKLGEIQMDSQKKSQVITYYDEGKVSRYLHEKLCSELNCIVSSKILLLNKEQPQGFKRNWKPVIMQPSKHIAYAVQWFSMTFVLIVIFVYWLRKQKEEGSAK